ncbi:MAG: methyltransferase domain-containing protein [Synechococcaceae cyanobacterium]|nr:methyltransferase domain-containing protein [Synechococcaceae cyanobacterium]
MPTQDVVADYYGRQLRSSADLRTSACCDADAVPAALRPLLARIHPEVSERYYGCGLVCPPLLEGLRVLDLGCGSGRDVVLLAQLVGPGGSVVGVDMTPEQLAVARRHQAFHQTLEGIGEIAFLEGTIERLEELPLQPGSFDLIVSNCVLNLSTDKAAVLRGAHRLLREGGEFYFSDISVDRRLDAAIRAHPVLWGECLGGALYWGDLLRLARAAGFPDPRRVDSRPLQINDPELAVLLGSARFCSATLRLFRIEGLEDGCEDHGQAVIYRGTIPGHPDRFVLDVGHVIETGRVFPVCGNTARILATPRFAPHFEPLGDTGRHFGPFPGCSASDPFASEGVSASQRGGAAPSVGSCC